jgi:hypothetical protein
MSREYFDTMRVHVDEGGKLTHQNGLDLLAEVERLTKALAPFAVYGGLIRLAGDPDGIPDETIASYLDLDGLTALEFREAHKAYTRR